MPVTEVSRPDPDEYAPFYADYVGRVTEDDPIEAMATQIEQTSALLGRVAEADAGARYAAGKWSVKEVVGHLTDAERIFSYRALRIARGDDTPLPGFDENAYVPAGRFDERALRELAGDLANARRATLDLFRSFDGTAWRGRGVASGNPISVRALARIIPGHERHHVEVLQTRYGLR